MKEHQRKDWKELALLAAGETDPEKLLVLIQELNDVLDASDPRPPDADAAATALQGKIRQRAS